jgi:hypothetical protein
MRLWRYEIFPRDEFARRTSDAWVDFSRHPSQRHFWRVSDLGAVVQRTTLFLDVDYEYSAGWRNGSLGIDEPLFPHMPMVERDVVSIRHIIGSSSWGRRVARLDKGTRRAATAVASE